MVRQQVGCKVEKVLQVAIAAHIAPKDGEDLESMGIGESFEERGSLFKRGCIKNS